MTHFTLKQINDMQANGEISMTEAIQLRIETRKAIEAGKADEQPKQQKRKQPKQTEPEEEEDTDTIAPPPKQQKRKQQTAKDKQTAKQPKQDKQAKQPKQQVERETREVVKYNVPGATEVEWCPTAIIYQGEGWHEGTYHFKIGKHSYQLSADAWSVWCDGVFNEEVGNFIREQIGL